jgi:hypothetical protein
MPASTRGDPLVVQTKPKISSIRSWQRRLELARLFLGPFGNPDDSSGNLGQGDRVIGLGVKSSTGIPAI